MCCRHVQHSAGLGPDPSTSRQRPNQTKLSNSPEEIRYFYKLFTTALHSYGKKTCSYVEWNNELKNFIGLHGWVSKCEWVCVSVLSILVCQTSLTSSHPWRTFLHRCTDMNKYLYLMPRWINARQCLHVNATLSNTSSICICASAARNEVIMASVPSLDTNANPIITVEKRETKRGGGQWQIWYNIN